MPDKPAGTEQPAINSVGQAFDNSSAKLDLAQFLEPSPAPEVAKPATAQPQPGDGHEDEPNVAASAEPDAAVEESPEAPETPAPEAEAAEGIPETAEAEPEEPEAEAEDSEDLPAATKQRIKKRIGKEVSRRKTVETELTAAQAKIAELEARTKTSAKNPPAAAPWEELPEVADLRQDEANAEKAVELARDLMDRLNDEPEAVAEYLQKVKIALPQYDPRSMRRALSAIERNAASQSEEKRARRVLLTRDAEKAYQGESAKAQAAAVAMAPWWKDKTNPNHVYAQQILDFVPEIKRSPYWQLALTDMVAGRELRLAKAKAGGKPAPAPRKPAPTPHSGGKPERVSDRQSSASAKEQAFARNPSRETLAATLS